MDISSSKNLSRLAVEAQIIKELRKSITEIFDGIPLVNLGYDVELIGLICQNIEDTLFYRGLNGDKKNRSDKMEIFFSVYSQVIGQVDDNEKQKLSRIVNFVVNNTLIERGILDKIIYVIKRCFRSS